MVDKVALDSATLLQLSVSGIISGSALINPVQANDIDVFTPFSVTASTLQAYNLEEYFPLQGDLLYERAMEYKEITNVYRNDDGVNLIVVHPTF